MPDFREHCIPDCIPPQPAEETVTSRGTHLTSSATRLALISGAQKRRGLCLLMHILQWSP